MSVIVSKDFIAQTEDLSALLYEKEYFSYKENAKEYVATLYELIESYIEVKRKRKTPKNLIRHGNYYITVNISKRTTWYVFFDVQGELYKVNYLTNNHVSSAAYLRGVK